MTLFPSRLLKGTGLCWLSWILHVWKTYKQNFPALCPSESRGQGQRHRHVQLYLSFLFQFSQPSLCFTRAVTFSSGCQRQDAGVRRACMPVCVLHVQGREQDFWRAEQLHVSVLTEENPKQCQQLSVSYRCPKAQVTCSDVFSKR